MEHIYVSLIKGVRKPTHKVSLFICGSSGTGKTSLRSEILKDVRLHSTFVYMNVDDIRPIVGSHESARAILPKLIAKARNDGYSVVVDATCRNTGDIISEMKKFHQKGYRVVIAMVYAELDTALSRIKARTSQTMPVDVAKGIYTELSRKAHRYMDVSHVDEIYLYNNEDSAKLLLEKKK